MSRPPLRPKRTLSYNDGGPGQPRLDRDLLRFLWQEEQSGEPFKQWKLRKTQEMEAFNAEQQREKESREREEREAERLANGPWTAEEWHAWQTQQAAEREAQRKAEEDRQS